MENLIDQIMDFNPASLECFNEPESTNYNANIYKTSPANVKTPGGHYISRVKLLYNPFDIDKSVVNQAKYAMNDSQGFFMVKSKLGNGDRSCPIFQAWRSMWYSGNEAKKEFARNMFDKSESKWVLVQIIEDDNQPDLVGSIKAWKIPKVVYEKLIAKMNPAPESKKMPVRVMDYLIGVPLDIDVAPGPDDPSNPLRKMREVSYSLCEFDKDYLPITKTDGTPLFDEKELDLIDRFATAKQDFAKAKSSAKKNEAQEFFDKHTKDVIALYTKALEYLKANAFDLNKECGFSEWNEYEKKRVENWINCVLDMKNPKSVTLNEDVEKAASEIANDFVTLDDLPF